MNCQQDQAEALADILLEAGALSVSVEDADSDSDLEEPLFGEPGLEPEVPAWRRNRLVALLPADLDPQELVAVVEESGVSPESLLDWDVRVVADADWVRLVQSQFEPLRIGRGIWIVPSWHRDHGDLSGKGPHEEAAEQAGVIRIELDPGLAFGTGSHPTTRLCLEWLERFLEPGESVLDYGCGSGILAIAASLLGAGTVRAVDIDRQAVEATRYNAQVNHVAIQAMLPDALESGQAQVVVANILSSPLKVLAPMLSERVAPGGKLALSGILEWQASEVAEAYAPWIDMGVWREHDGWVCLHGTRNR